MILSLFEYLRNRTRDAFLAGVYDALEIIEADASDEQNVAAECVARKLGLGAENHPPQNHRPPQPQPPGANQGGKPPPPSGQLAHMGGMPRNLLPRKRGRPPKNPPGPSPQQP